MVCKEKSMTIFKKSMKRKKLGGENMTKATEDKRLKEVKKVIEEWDIKQKQEKGRNGGD